MVLKSLPKVSIICNKFFIENSKKTIVPMRCVLGKKPKPLEVYYNK